MLSRPLLVLTALALPAVAGAQGGRAAINAYTPAVAARDGFAVPSGDVDHGRALSWMLAVDYASAPLQMARYVGTSAETSESVVAHHLVAHAVFTKSFRDRLQLHVTLPVDLFQGGDDTLASSAHVRDPGVGLGNARVGSRVRILGGGESAYALSVDVRLVLPTASVVDSNQYYRGDDGLALEASALAHYEVGPLRIAGNLGVRVARDQIFLATERGEALTYGLGVSLPLLDDALVVHAEGYGAAGFDLDDTTLELMAGAKYFASKGLYAGLAAGAGLVAGVGSPEFRVVAMFGRACDRTPARAHGAEGHGGHGGHEGHGAQETDEAAPPAEVDGPVGAHVHADAFAPSAPTTDVTASPFAQEPAPAQEPSPEPSPGEPTPVEPAPIEPAPIEPTSTP